MEVIDVSERGEGAFRDAVLNAKRGDWIVYHVGPHCYNALSRRAAMGACEASLVNLAKKRVDRSVGFQHIAIRSRKNHQPYKSATDYL